MLYDFSFLVPGIKLKASPMPERHWNNEVYPQPCSMLFLCVYIVLCIKSVKQFISLNHTHFFMGKHSEFCHSFSIQLIILFSHPIICNSTTRSTFLSKSGEVYTHQYLFIPGTQHSFWPLIISICYWFYVINFSCHIWLINCGKCH